MQEETMLYNELFRKLGVKNSAQLRSPKTYKQNEFTLPKASVIHYVSGQEQDTGMEPQHMLIADEEIVPLVTHIYDHEVIKGSARRGTFSEDAFRKAYHKRYRRMRFVRRVDAAFKSKNNVLVYNHAPGLYNVLYRTSAMSSYYRAYNVLHNFFTQLSARLDNPEWMHWVPLELPINLPTMELLKMVDEEEEVPRTHITAFNEFSELLVLEMWKWASGLPSLMDLIPLDKMSMVNFIWIEGLNWQWLNLGTLAEIRSSEKGTQFAKSLYQFFEHLYETRTPIEMDDTEVPETEADRDDRMQGPILERAIELADAGRLSPRELTRMEKLAGKYKTISNPFGEEGTLEDVLEVTDEDIQIETIQLPDIKGVPRQEYLTSSLENFDAVYLEKVMHKDIATAVMSAQRSGIVVLDYKTKRITDVANDKIEHTVRLQPVDGEPSTIKFTIPNIKPDGTYLANGVKYRMAKQPGDLPIRKVKPNRVALTSYYGKFFIERSERTIHDYSLWLGKKLNLMSTGSDSTLDDAHHGNFAYTDTPTPRAYNAIASKLASFKYGGISYYFDYKTREDVFGEKAVSEFEKSGDVLVGKHLTKPDIYVVMDSTGIMRHVGKSDTVLGMPEEALDIQGKVPLDTIMLGISGKALPVGVCLGFFIGFSKLLKILKATHRVVPKGTRADIGSDEYGIVFSDETYVLKRTEVKAALLLGGFNFYKTQIARMTVSELDRANNYSTILNSAGLKATRFLRALTSLRERFVDDITLRELKVMGEPLNVDGLFIRSAEMLVTDECNDEVEFSEMRLKGYERVSGMVYGELTKAIRAYKMRPVGSGAKVEMNPQAVWQTINQDASVMLVGEINPVHELKERETVVYTGQGGRSAQSMTISSRKYHESHKGVFSEGVPDSGKVGVTQATSANPMLKDLRGTANQWTKEDGAERLVSNTSLLMPGLDHDDPKRTDFARIQFSHGVGSPAYKAMPYTSGYDLTIAHRVGELYSFIAQQDGQITELTDKAMTVTYKDGTGTIAEMGRILGIESGTYYPQPMVTDRAKGYRFKKGEVLAFNKYYFERSLHDPKQVTFKAAMPVNVAMMENTGTLEDSCTISAEIGKKLTTEKIKVRSVLVGFDQSIEKLVSVGDKVDSDSILCYLQDASITETSGFSDDTLASLDALSMVTPRAQASGYIERIEVFYFGDKDNMSESLRKTVTRLDKERSKDNAELGRDSSITGKVTSPINVGGVQLKPGNVAIKIYIAKEYNSSAGDKGVFGNQLKTVVGDVYNEPIVSFGGITVDAIFSYASVANRIVRSPEKMGTTNLLLVWASTHVANTYFEG